MYLTINVASREVLLQPYGHLLTLCSMLQIIGTDAPKVNQSL